MPQTSNHKVLSALRLWYPPVVQAMASALLGTSPPEAHDFPEASLGHIHVNVCGTAHHLPPPGPARQFRQIMLSFLRDNDNRRYSPKSLLPLKPFDSGPTLNFICSTHSFIQQCLWDSAYFFDPVTILNVLPSFIYSTVFDHLLYTGYCYRQECTKNE